MQHCRVCPNRNVNNVGYDYQASYSYDGSVDIVVLMKAPNTHWNIIIHNEANDASHSVVTALRYSVGLLRGVSVFKVVMWTCPSPLDRMRSSFDGGILAKD